MLRFDYELVDGLPIRSVRGSGRQLSSDGSVGYEELLIGVGQNAVFIQVNLDTDELEVSLAESGTIDSMASKFTDVPELADCIGRELGWCWEVRNYRGYWDAFCISVSGIDPDFCFIGTASSIHLKRFSKLVAAQ